jgi:hypothetical protein
MAPSAYLRGQLPSILADVQQLPLDDPRRVEVERVAADTRERPPTDRDRIVVVSALEAVATASRRQRARVRSFQHIMLVTALTLTALLSALIAVSVLSPSLLSVCYTGPEFVVCPTGEQSRASFAQSGGSPWNLLVVAALGSMGAALSAVVSLRGVRGTASSGLTVVLAALKLPTGALTAVLAVLLMTSGAVPGIGRFDAPGQILGWAAIWGCAQQLLTGGVDARARAVLEGEEATSSVPALSSKTLERALSATLRQTLSRPSLVNFRGWLSVVPTTEQGGAVPSDKDGRLVLQQGTTYVLGVEIGPVEPVGSLSVPVVISDGDPAERVPFTIQLLEGPGEQAAREVNVELRPSVTSVFERFPLQAGAENESDSLWVRLDQLGHLIQLVEIQYRVVGGRE